MEKGIYDYVLSEEATWKTLRVPITNSVDWNMYDHIQRCTNVANGWFHGGKNDGLRPYNDVVTPILNVARRSEGFDVKDITPYVNEADNYHKSFLVKHYHPQWARKNELDTFIDDMVESSVVYDLALIKNCNDVRPEVVPLQSIAFCDQTNVLSGPLALKHMYSPAELSEYSEKWNKDKVEEAILMAEASKTVKMANDQTVKTPGKYIEVYEVHGYFPDSWLNDGGSITDYTPQMHIIAYYQNEQGKKNGITLFKGPEKKPIFKALVLSPVFGRACGRSLVESLFEEQTWANYDEIQIKEMLDAAAVILFHTDDDEIGDKKLSQLKKNKVLKLGQGRSFGRTDTTVPNIAAFQEHQKDKATNARIKGSASEGSLGINPSSGTPFALENAVIQQGQGIHEHRQGKIATFMSDQLYKDWILKFLVDEMNGGKKFSEELSLSELQEIAKRITTGEIERRIKRMILATGKVPTEQEREVMRTKFQQEFMASGSRRFFEVLQKELDGIPVDVYVNIAGKQKDLAKNADKMTNLIMAVIKNPGAFSGESGIGDLFNELVEDAGYSPVNFAGITEAPAPQPQPAPAAPVGVPANNNALPVTQ